MDCPNCGRPIPAQAASCPSCGAALSSAAQTRPRRRLSKLAIAAFVLSLAAGVWFLVDQHRTRTPELAVGGALLLDLLVLAVPPRRVQARSGKPFAAAGLVLLILLGMLTGEVYRLDPEQRESICSHNLAGLRQALEMYRNLNRDALPPGDAWCDALLKTGFVVEESQFLCTERPYPSDARSSYAINSAVAGKRPDGSPQTVLLFEIDGGWNVSGGRERMISKPRHPGGFMFLLVNGEVKAVPKKELGQLEW
jgi:predicted nucleic acid-binding Zn ribbon protein